jgi:hypothetical protein
MDEGDSTDEGDSIDEDKTEMLTKNIWMKGIARMKGTA